MSGQSDRTFSQGCPQERKRESERASERARVKDLCQTSQLCCFAVYYYNPTISLSTLLKRETDRRGPVPLRGHHQQQQAYEVVFWTLCLPRVLNERTWIVFKYREAILYRQLNDARQLCMRRIGLGPSNVTALGPHGVQPPITVRNRRARATARESCLWQTWRRGA